MKRLIVLVVFASFFTMLPALGVARGRAYEWHSGVLKAERRSDTLAGFSGSARANKIGNSVVASGDSDAVYYVHEIYVIRGDDGIEYTASQRLRWRWSHRADLIVNDPVDFRVAGRTLFVKGSDGKVHKCRIVERARVSRPSAE
jgi:hypothetical protein